MAVELRMRMRLLEPNWFFFVFFSSEETVHEKKYRLILETELYDLPPPPPTTSADRVSTYAHTLLVSCPDHTLYAREGLVHEVQILGSDGKFSHYEYHCPIHGLSGKVWTKML